MANKVSLAKPKTRIRWRVATFLTVGTIINYIDRVNFGVAAPTLMKEFGLNPAEMGVLMSAFFISYTLMMIPSGYFLNRIGPKKVLGMASILWGVVTMLTGACQNVFHFIAVRIGLGITEAPAFPSNARVISVWVPIRERTFATAMFDCSARAGNIIAPPIVVWCIMTFGWKISFIVTGGLAVIWGILWFLVYHEPSDHPKMSSEELSYIRQNETLLDDGNIESHPIPIHQLISYPVFVKASIAYTMYVYIWVVFQYWIPTYLIKEKGLSMEAMGYVATIPFIFAVVAELAGGKFFDKWYDRGANVSILRRTGMGIGMIGAAFFIFLCTKTATAFWAIVWISCFMAVASFGASNVWAIPSDIAPYKQAGGVAGLYNFIGHMGALAAPAVTGFIIQSKFGFNGAFYVCTAFGIIGGLLFIFNDYERLRPKKITSLS